MHSSRKNEPSDIKRPRRWEAIGYNLNEPSSRDILDRFQNRLHRSCADTEKDENVDDEKLVVARHDEVVKSGEGRDGMSFLGDEQQDEWNEDGEQGDEKGGDE